MMEVVVVDEVHRFYNRIYPMRYTFLNWYLYSFTLTVLRIKVSNKLTSIIAMFPVDDVCSLNGDTQDVMELLQHKDNIDKTMQELMKYFNCISYRLLIHS